MLFFLSFSFFVPLRLGLTWGTFFFFALRPTPIQRVLLRWTTTLALWVIYQYILPFFFGSLADPLHFLIGNLSHQCLSPRQTPSTNIEWGRFCELVVVCRTAKGTFINSFSYSFPPPLFVDLQLPWTDGYLPYRSNHGHGLWMYFTSWRSWQLRRLCRSWKRRFLWESSWC